MNLNFMPLSLTPNQVLEWDTAAIQGQHRWLTRVWETVAEATNAHSNGSSEGPNSVETKPEQLTKEARELEATVHSTIERVTQGLFEATRLLLPQTP